jgi:putative glutamine amidotransferase
LLVTYAQAWSFFASGVVLPEGAASTFWNDDTMRIGLSYHGGDSDYDDYPAALLRRATALGLTIDATWLAGASRPTQIQLLDDIDAIVFTGGPDVEPHRYGYADVSGHCASKPERDAIEWEMLERLRGRPLPTLAICRGAQIVNVFHGGSLIPDLGELNAAHRRNGEERRVHKVAIEPGSLLHRLAGTESAEVNTSHHQAVDRLAATFRPTAFSHDGVLEAYELAKPAAEPFFLAVQWHPEGMMPGLPLADRVLDGLLLLCSSGNIKNPAFAEKH